MKRIAIALFAALILISVMVLYAFAQDEVERFFSPIAIDVTQQVPTEVTIAVPLEDGSTYTTTLPLTLTVDLRVEVTGAEVVDLAVNESRPEVLIEPISSGDELVDNNGISYALENTFDGIEFLELYTRGDGAYGTKIMGIMKNEGDDGGDVKLLATFYDAEGNVLAVGDGYLGVPQLRPGLSAAFELSVSVPLEDVARYRIQVGPR